MNTGINVDIDDDEYLTGRECPHCNLPTVYEFGIEVCYYCGWTEEEDNELSNI